MVLYSTRHENVELPDSILADAALSLAEGMGFLFEEEWLDAQHNERANEIWREFSDQASPLEANEATEDSAAAVTQAAAPIRLTKFRRFDSGVWDVDSIDPCAASGVLADTGS